MQMTISTSRLQSLVAKSVKGSSNNKMLPLTNLMCIELKAGKLKLITMDGSNYLYVTADIVSDEDFYVVVQTDLFSKLISRLTCENTTLKIEDDNLVVKGNGTYTIELPLDEEASLITFPDPLSHGLEDTTDSTIDLATVNLMLNSAKASLLTDTTVMCYTGYYMGNRIITTDTCKICGINTYLWDDAVLLNSAMVDLLGLMDAEKITVKRKDNTIVFTTGNCSVYGKTMSCIDDFSIGTITSFLDDTYDSTCKVMKNELLQLLDRISLFVSPYDKNCIRLVFSQNCIDVWSKHASVESIEYQTCYNNKGFTCYVDVERFKTQVKAVSGDVIEIQYGKDNALKLVDANVVQVVALEEEE